MLLSKVIEQQKILPMPDVNTNQCPLCQKNNLCAIDSSTPCWCVKSEIKRELLAKVPQELAGKSCICKKCIDKFNFDNIIDRS